MMDCLIMSSLLFVSNPWMSVTICHVKFVIFNMSGSISILYVSTQLVSLIESTQLGQVLQLYLIIFYLET